MQLFSVVVGEGSKLMTDFFTSKSKGISGVQSSTASSSVSSVSSSSLQSSLLSSLMTEENMDKIVSETKDQTEREFRSRLRRSIVASSTASVSSAKRARLEEPQQSNIPVEKIVIENNLKFGEREIQMMKSVKEVLFASSVSTTNSISVVVGQMRMRMSELEEQSMRFCKNLLDMTNTTPSMAMSMTTIQSLLQHTVEEHALDEVYIAKICELQDQLRNKDMVMEELKTLVTERDVNRFVPDIVIKVASLLDNPSDDCAILASILKNLVENQAKNVKRWNEETKSLFATILDNGGPPLARIVTEKLSGPSLQTMYRSARSDYAIPMTLQERTLERAAHLYQSIGYRGVFALAVDATFVP
ncbi:unnamed protein product [Porites lobata]|uniref:Vitellogenin n=1 Tax=Porites lobata TaxID=104759 RepID=A0ABN8Q138_9CNID|nr:unnamed protein product [Porites lobata]